MTYAGRNLCKEHFTRYTERRFKRELRKQLEDLGLDDGARIAVGLSGGKDSAALTALLQQALGPDPSYEIVPISVDEGIPGYRDQALAKATELTDALGLDLQVTSHAEDHGVTTQQVAEDQPETRPCAACGVFRRSSLNQAARSADADCVATGHNLDDTAETALMNLLKGDLDQVLRTAPHTSSPDGLVPRITPLRDAPEREVALYAILQDLPFHDAECPHSVDATRRTYKALLLDLVDQDPTVRHSLVSLTDKLKARVEPQETGELGVCQACGEPTPREVCRACELADVLGP